MDAEPVVFVGIDWASTEYQVCLTGADGPVQRAFAHDATGIGTMVDWLCAQAEQPEHVAVAIETPHGPIVEALMDRGIAVFAINPKLLDRFRDRFSPAGQPLGNSAPCFCHRSLPTTWSNSKATPPMLT